MALAVLGRACGGEPAAGGSDGGAGEAGANGGSAGTAGTGGSSAAGTAGSGGTATGGTAGAAGSSFGAAPVWKELPELVGACHVEKLQNPGAVRAFVWQPCSWSSGCEQAHMNPALVKQDAAFTPPGQASDDGTRVVIALDALETNMALIMREDGSLYAAYHVVNSADADCEMAAASTWGEYYGAFPALRSLNEYGAVTASISGSDHVFTIPKPYPAPTPGGYYMGSKLWIWEWIGGQYSSMSAVDGSGFQQFTAPLGDIKEIDKPAVAGDEFFFTTWRVGDGGQLMREIDRSDGLSDLQPFLVGTYDAQWCSPAYANNYLGFLKGLHPPDVYSYKDIEIWAAPYVTDPAKLQPKKLGDHNLHDIGAASTFGGWGHMAVPTFTDASHQTVQLDVWNLESGTVKHYVGDPSFGRESIYGVTRKYVYAGLAKKSIATATLCRLAVE